MTGTLYGAFAATADRLPDAPAVELPDVTLSYAALARAAESVAARLHAARPGARRIALLAARSPLAYAGYLAALRLNAAVVPLSPGHPPARHARVCAAARPDLVLTDLADPATDATGAAAERGLADPPVFRLTDDEILHAPSAAPAPGFAPEPDALAYLLFTSGTTGRPKGIGIRHRNVLPFLRTVVDRHAIGPGCRMSHTFDLTFDLSVYDLFATWTGGATLVVPDGAELLSPVEYVRQRRLTHWFSVPSAVSVAQGTGHLPAGHAPGLRQSTFCGEPLTLDQAAAWLAAAPGTRIDNLYGPTELTVACTGYRLPERTADWPRTSNGTVPVGEPFDGLEHRVAPDTGELWVRGPQRFDGYLDPADDAGRFADGYYRTGDRFRRENGELVHLGRLDDQLKIRGHRVEPGEVEVALRRVPGVREAAVVAAARDGVTDLTACWTGTELTRRELVRALRAVLPLHLVPRRFLHLPELPRNANGKVDRAALRRHAAEAADAVLT